MCGITFDTSYLQKGVGRQKLPKYVFQRDKHPVSAVLEAAQWCGAVVNHEEHQECDGSFHCRSTWQYEGMNDVVGIGEGASKKRAKEEACRTILEYLSVPEPG